MEIGIIAVGRLKNGPERDLFSRYYERSKKSAKQLGLSGFSLKELPESQRKNTQERKSEEAKAIRKALPTGAITIVLDEHGKSISSTEFASKISSWADEGNSLLQFIIGGADGLEKDLIKEASLVIGFSKMTWPHQLVRIMLAEQIYRTTTILNSHPYHRS